MMQLETLNLVWSGCAAIGSLLLATGRELKGKALIGVWLIFVAFVIQAMFISYDQWHWYGVIGVFIFVVLALLLGLRKMIFKIKKKADIVTTDEDGDDDSIQQGLPSLDLVYELTKSNYELISRWSDALDNKLVATFGVGTLIIGIVTTIGAPITKIDISFILFVLAVIAFICTVISVWKGYKVNKYYAALNPKTLLEQFAVLTDYDAKYWLTKYSCKHYAYNKAIVDNKSRYLNITIISVSIEVILLLSWIILS